MNLHILKLNTFYGTLHLNILQFFSDVCLMRVMSIVLRALFMAKYNRFTDLKLVNIAANDNDATILFVHYEIYSARLCTDRGYIFSEVLYICFGEN